MSSKPSNKPKTIVSNRPFIGVGIMLWRDDCLLLGQRIDSSGEMVWQFPGGHLDIGETVLECAAREVLEETGLVIGYAKHAGFSNEMFSLGEREYVTLYVSAAYLSGEAEVMEPVKCKGWRWFSYDQLPEPLFLPIINLMKQAPDLSIYRVDAETRAGEQK